MVSRRCLKCPIGGKHRRAHDCVQVGEWEIGRRQDVLYQPDRGKRRLFVACFEQCPVPGRHSRQHVPRPVLGQYTCDGSAFISFDTNGQPAKLEQKRVSIGFLEGCPGLRANVSQVVIACVDFRQTTGVNYLFFPRNLEGLTLRLLYRVREGFLRTQAALTRFCRP